MKDNCQKCGHKLTVLFYTKDCERCNNKTSQMFYKGYVLWTLTPEAIWEVQEHPIFRTSEDAGKWWKSNPTYLSSFFEVREVISQDHFDWVPDFYFAGEVADIRYRVAYKLSQEKSKKPTVIMLPLDVLLPDVPNLLLNKEDRVAIGIEP